MTHNDTSGNRTPTARSTGECANQKASEEAQMIFSSRKNKCVSKLLIFDAFAEINMSIKNL